MSNPSSPRIAILRAEAQAQADTINAYHRQEGREVHARIVEGWCYENPGSPPRRQYEIVSDFSGARANGHPPPPSAPARAKLLAGIFDAVFSATSVGEAAILSDSREPRVVRARWIAWTLATERHVDLGLPALRLSTRIGELFSRPRSTIRYGVRSAMKSSDPDFVAKLARARAGRL